MGFVDLHAHMLPALDDGAPDAATTLAMLRTLASVGYEHVTATPHQKSSQFMPTHDAIASAYANARAALEANGVPLTLHLAAENYWDEVLFARTRDGSFPRYDEGRAFLFEIPVGEVPARFEETLFQWRVDRWLPVLAHPERYAPFWHDVDRVARLGAGTPLLVDLGAIAGYHGAQATKLARRLVSERIAHAVASDAHSVDDVRTAAEGIAWIKKKLGNEAVARLLDENPRRILAGEMPEA